MEFLDSGNSFSKGKEEGSHIESIVVLLFKSTYSYVTLAQNKKRSIQFIEYSVFFKTVEINPAFAEEPKLEGSWWRIQQDLWEVAG